MYPAGKTSGGAPAPANRPVQVPSLMDDGEIHVLPVQGNVYMLVGGGGNTTVQIGKDGVLVVDTKLAAQADKLIAAIRKISDKPIRYVLNTSADAELTGGNEKVADAGRTITGGNVAGFNAGFPATMVAHEKVAARMREAGAPPAGWPMDT
jgi:glyoxylase-like metal-dependent hydrolase (beta-lactamase superfamily II)